MKPRHNTCHRAIARTHRSGVRFLTPEDRRGPKPLASWNDPLLCSAWGWIRNFDGPCGPFLTAMRRSARADVLGYGGALTVGQARALVNAYTKRSGEVPPQVSAEDVTMAVAWADTTRPHDFPNHAAAIIAARRHTADGTPMSSDETLRLVDVWRTRAVSRDEVKVGA